MAVNGKNGKNAKNGHKKQNGHSDWAMNLRWSGIIRPYSYEDVHRLRGTIQIEYTLARLGAERGGKGRPELAQAIQRLRPES